MSLGSKLLERARESGKNIKLEKAEKVRLKHLEANDQEIINKFVSAVIDIITLVTDSGDTLVSIWIIESVEEKEVYGLYGPAIIQPSRLYKYTIFRKNVVEELKSRLTDGYVSWYYKSVYACSLEHMWTLNINLDPKIIPHCCILS